MSQPVPKAECPVCLEVVQVRLDGTLRRHPQGAAKWCYGSEEPADNNVRCEHCQGRGWVRAATEGNRKP